MKLQSYKRIISNDYKEEDRDTIETLGGSVNDAFNQLYQLLNKRFSLNDNMQATVRTIELSVDASGNPLVQTSFSLDVPNTPIIGVSVLSAQNQENTAVYPTSCPFVSYTQNGNSVIINNVTGLPSNQRFKLVIVAFN